jgi:hypothetical protein
VLSKTISRCVVAIAVLASVAAATASAQTLDERVFFTFSAPVELPGVGLAPGKYIFRLADPTSSHNVVQVLSADGKTPYGIFFTLPAERPTPAPQPEVVFMETPAGTPKAIKAWWNQGETTGHEFIYPKEHARRLAQNSSEPVLTTQSETKNAAQTNTPDLVRMSRDGREAAVNAASKPVAAAPKGTTQQGEAASPSIAVPTVIVAIVARPDR